MAQVTVTIDGKAYRMACEEGQENHLVSLATQFDRYVGHLKGQFGEIGDLRITVMAGIMIMDELSELNRRIASLEADLEEARGEANGAMRVAAEREDMLIAAIGEMAERLNGLTRKLTGRAQAPVAAET